MDCLGFGHAIGGPVYALFPNQMIEMMRKLPDIPPASLRVMGIVGVMLGWLLIRWVRT